MNKEILELLHKQDAFYFMLGSLISADNNMSKEEVESNKEDLRSIIELLEKMISEGNTTIPEEFLVEYHKLALKSLKALHK